MDYEKLLNIEQLMAVQNTEGPVMVSAGAGSGKTRLLTYRVKYLVDVMGVNPLNILAITFTNKAANEMKERISNLLEMDNNATICTIHSFCARLLRKYVSFLPNYKENFSIYSESDCNKIYKEIFKKMHIEESETKDRLKDYVSKIKNENMDIDTIVEVFKFYKDINLFPEFFEEYQKSLISNNAMDFDDLLTYTYQILNKNQEVLESVQNRYRYIHIDEFQDTNVVQYDIIKLIADKYQNIFVVGDENQSIYGWRGANPDNMRQFLKDFSNAKIFKMEQNYRSTEPILKSANALIKYNENLIEKELFTDKKEGKSVVYYSAYDEQDEADFVIRNILQLNRQGLAFKDMAILMRINALSRPFEEKLLNYNIPHKIYNGFKFYERQEIKNTLAYLIACANPEDNNSFARIINFPKRAIGETSIQKLQILADAYKTPLKSIVINYADYDLPSALKQKLQSLKELLLDFDNKSTELEVYDFAKYVVDKTGILLSFDKENETELERYHNVNSLLQSIQEFANNNPSVDYKEYLETITLITNIDEMQDDNNCVSIASIHGAKGLEFDTVFICGCEEKILPIERCGDLDLEEERRLMYVAITRAKNNLFLTSCKSRFLYGMRNRALPSRFLREAEIIKDEPRLNINFNNLNYSQEIADFSYAEIRARSTANMAKKETQKLDINQISIGVKVEHSRFGIGTIVKIDDLYSNKCIDIKFDGVGIKTLCIDYAPLSFV